MKMFGYFHCLYRDFQTRTSPVASNERTAARRHVVNHSRSTILLPSQPILYPIYPSNDSQESSFTRSQSNNDEQFPLLATLGLTTNKRNVRVFANLLTSHVGEPHLTGWTKVVSIYFLRRHSYKSMCLKSLATWVFRSMLGIHSLATAPASPDSCLNLLSSHYNKESIG